MSDRCEGLIPTAATDSGDSDLPLMDLDLTDIILLCVLSGINLKCNSVREIPITSIRLGLIVRDGQLELCGPELLYSCKHGRPPESRCFS